MSNQIIGARYRLSSRLGEGGMAEVHFGLDVQLCRPVAVKRLRRELAADPLARAAFEREVRIGGRLSHPNIVSVFDAGMTDDPDTGVPVPYIVLEFVPGVSLQQHLDLRDGHAMPPRQAVEVVGALLSALASSHAAGVIHSDVKPGNVMVTPDGRVKLMDFGIARSLDEDTPGPIRLSEIRGSVRYVAPERLRGGISDARSDIYSVGCLLYRLLVGSPPFQGGSTSDILARQLSEAPSPPSQARPSLGSGFDAVVLRALAKDPEDRYPSADAMAADLVDQPKLRSDAQPRRLPAAAPARSLRRQRLVAAGVAAALLPLAGLAVQSLDRGKNQASDLGTAAAGGRPTAPRAGALPEPSIGDGQVAGRGEPSPPRLAASSPSAGAPTLPSASPSRRVPPAGGDQVSASRRSDGRGSPGAAASLRARPTTAAQPDGGGARPVRTLPPRPPARTRDPEPARPRPPAQAVRPPDAPAPAKPQPVEPSPPVDPPQTPEEPRQPDPPSTPPTVEDRPAVPKPERPEKPEKPEKPPKPPKPDKVVIELADPTAAAQALSAGEAGLG